MGRGESPEDRTLFGAAALPRLRAAVLELSWLRSRGYADAAALELVGNHHQLHARARLAVRRAACSNAALGHRTKTRVGGAALSASALGVDGFNCLIAIESALCGGPIIAGRDGCLRDLASIHGSYKTVAVTGPALERLLMALAGAAPSRIVVLLDRPVSNSGRLAEMIQERALALGLKLEVELHDSPDAELSRFEGIVASGDGPLLDRCAAHIDLPALALAGCDFWRVDLSGTESSGRLC